MEINKTLALVSIVVIIVGGGVGWGTLQARVDNVVREQERIRHEIEFLKLDTVRKGDFQAVISELKSDNKIIKEDIKKILEKLK